MNILFINTNIGYGGATKIMLWLAERFANAGNQITYLTYRDATEARPVPKGIRHIHFQLENDGHSILGLFDTVVKLRRFIKANSFDVGIAFLSPSQLRLSLAAIGTKMKVLLSQRGDPYRSVKSSSLMSKLSDFAFRMADLYVFQTSKAKEYYSKSIQSRSTVIPNPVKPLKRTLERKPDNRIVNVARLDINQKRQDLLIDAFKIVKKKYPDITLHFYGDGNDEAQLREQAIGQDDVFFDGVSNDIVRDIQNARLFVLSSDFEGLPNALIEAMSLGIPCVSTKCSPGGAEFLINNGENGLLTPCDDAIGLANGIIRFLDCPDFAEQCGQKATSIIQLYSEDKIFHCWEQFILGTND